MQHHQSIATSISPQDIAIALGLTLLALITRIYGLGTWAIIQDEYFTVTDAANRTMTLINPAYYWLVLGSFKLFGVSEWSVRFPSMVLGVISVPVFYLTWRNILGRHAALIGSVLIIFSSWHLWHSQYARYYTGVFLFASLAYTFYYGAILSGRRSQLVLSLLCSAAAFLFHATAILVPVSLAVFSVAILLLDRPSTHNYSRNIAKLYLAVCVLGALAMAPVLWQQSQLWQSTGQSWGKAPGILLLKLAEDIQLSLAVSAVLGLALLYRTDFAKFLFLALVAGVPVAALLLVSAIMPFRTDYVFNAMPPIIALASLLCMQAATSWSAYGIVKYSLATLVITGMLPGFVSHYTDRGSLDIREVVDFINKAYRPGDRVMSFSTGFQYYWKYPLEPHMSSPRNKAGNWESSLAPYREGNQRLWVVLRVMRRPLAPDLEHWLLNNASLAWRKSAVRYDFGTRGYEVFLVNGDPGMVQPDSEIDPGR